MAIVFSCVKKGIVIQSVVEKYICAKVFVNTLLTLYNQTQKRTHPCKINISEGG